MIGNRVGLDPNAMVWNAPRPAPRQPKSGTLLFEFIRARDQAPMTCELRFHREWRWEAQFYDRGEFLYSRRFDTRALAAQWAEEERKTIEQDGADDR